MPEDHAVEDGSRKFMTCSVTVFSGAEARSIGQSSTRARSFPSSNGFGRTSVGIGTEEGPSRSGRLRSLAMHEAQSLEFLDPAVARGDRDPEAAPRSIADAGRSNVPRRMRVEYSSMIVRVTCRASMVPTPV